MGEVVGAILHMPPRRLSEDAPELSRRAGPSGRPRSREGSGAAISRRSRSYDRRLRGACADSGAELAGLFDESERRSTSASTTSGAARPSRRAVGRRGARLPWDARRVSNDSNTRSSRFARSADSFCALPAKQASGRRRSSKPTWRRFERRSGASSRVGDARSGSRAATHTDRFSKPLASCLRIEPLSSF